MCRALFSSTANTRLPAVCQFTRTRCLAGYGIARTAAARAAQSLCWLLSLAIPQAAVPGQSLPMPGALGSFSEHRRRRPTRSISRGGDVKRAVAADVFVSLGLQCSYAVKTAAAALPRRLTDSSLPLIAMWFRFEAPSQLAPVEDIMRILWSSVSSRHARAPVVTVSLERPERSISGQKRSNHTHVPDYCWIRPNYR
jgi:hypothetical protein